MLQLKDGSEETLLAKGSATPCKYEGPILLGEDEVSVKVLLLQEGKPLAKLVMGDLNDNSDLMLSVEVSMSRKRKSRLMSSGEGKSAGRDFLDLPRQRVISRNSGKTLISIFDGYIAGSRGSYSAVPVRRPNDQAF